MSLKKGEGPFYSDYGHEFKDVKEAVNNLAAADPDILWLYEIKDGIRIDHTRLRRINGRYRRYV